MDTRVWGSIKYQIQSDEFEILVIDESSHHVVIKMGFPSIELTERWFHHTYPTGYIIPTWFVLT